MVPAYSYVFFLFERVTFEEFSYLGTFHSAHIVLDILLPKACQKKQHVHKSTITLLCLKLFKVFQKRRGRLGVNILLEPLKVTWVFSRF